MSAFDPTPVALPGKSLTLVWLGACWKALLVVGVVVRIAPLFDRNRVFWQFPTEDGYLTLTIARNVALGLGMTVSEGTIPTNGSQPLAMALWSLVFRVVGGDRLLGVGGVLLAETLLSVGLFVLIARLGEALFGGGRSDRALSSLAAALWFASPVVVPHTMNCLESTLYGIGVVATAWVYLRFGSSTGPWKPKALLVLGLLIGATFWARNDAVFFGAACAAVHVFALPGAPRTRRVLEVAAFGAIASLVALPWLANNLIAFGHLVPISGRSEAMDFRPLANLGVLPMYAAECLWLVVPIPESIGGQPWVAGGIAALVLATGIPLIRFAYVHAAPAARRLIAVLLIYGACLIFYYTALFGAPHFLNRYLFPLSPFIALFGALALQHGLARLSAGRARALAQGLAFVLPVLCVGFGVQLFRRGEHHEHRQVVDWVERHVPKTSWVGASQSGTLGFFHDRTINMDGKVNPEALEARRHERVPEYAIGKGMDFLADWVAFADAVKLPAFANFEVIVRDPEQNLAVLRRKGAPTLDEGSIRKPKTP